MAVVVDRPQILIFVRAGQRHAMPMVPFDALFRQNGLVAFRVINQRTAIEVSTFIAGVTGFVIPLCPALRRAWLSPLGVSSSSTVTSAAGGAAVGK